VIENMVRPRGFEPLAFCSGDSKSRAILLILFAARTHFCGVDVPVRR
jgi:hypothetical protein